MKESKELRVNEITSRMDEITTELCALNAELDDVRESIRNFDKSDYFTEKQYEEVLKDIYPNAVEICGITMCPVNILKTMDVTAFRQGMNDYIDSLDNDYFEEYNLLVEEESEIEFKISALESEQEELEVELSALLEEDEEENE